MKLWWNGYQPPNSSKLSPANVLRYMIHVCMYISYTEKCYGTLKLAIFELAVAMYVIAHQCYLIVQSAIIRDQSIAV